MTLMPTPTTADATRTSATYVRGNPTLPGAVTLLPTPTQSMTTGAGTSGRDGGLNLQTAVTLLSSRGPYEQAIRRWELETGRPAPEPTQISSRTGGPQLSPAFVEWMMNVPESWVTGVPGLTRNQQLSLLGDGVVFRQALHAYRQLIRDLLHVPALERAA